MTRIAISGVNGFVGSHLVRELVDHGHDAIGIGVQDGPEASIGSLLTDYLQADLEKGWPVSSQVDAIIHLAGLAAVGPSFDEPQRYIESNSAMLTHLCEFYLGAERPPRIVVVSSGAVYEGSQTLPITENGQIAPESPYVVSKLLLELQCDYYVRRGLDCVVMRPFNHIGPGQSQGFLLPDLYEQLAHAGSHGNVIKTGLLTTERDYTDVRDVVRAYRMVATQPELSDRLFNVCSGASMSGNEILNRLTGVLGLESILAKPDQAKLRPTNASKIVGSFDRLRRETGWSPTFTITQTIRDFVEGQASLGARVTDSDLGPV